MTKINVFAHILSCSPKSKSEQIVEPITSTKILFSDFEHITSTSMLLITLSTSPRPGDYQEARLSQNIFSEILGTIFLVG